MEAVNTRTTEITLEKLLKVVPDLGFIKRVNRIYQYHDEPKFFQYSAAVYVDPKETDGFVKESWKAGGSSMFDEKLAFLKCVAEAIERYSCMIYKRRNFVYKSFQGLNENAINPMLFSKFAEKQRKEKDFRRFVYDEKTPFTWTNANSLTSGKKFLIPAQLAYLNYKTESRDERLIDIPISTGAAFGKSFDEALMHGFFELVERDSFAIMYMNKTHCPKVDLTLIKDERVEYMLDQARRYRLNVHMIDITTDLGIPSFASVITNYTKIGPAVQVGIKSHFDPLQAIVGAFQESLHTRCWMRYLYENDREKYVVNNSEEINSFEQRGMYWYSPNMIRKLHFWIKQSETQLKYSTGIILSDKEAVTKIKKILIDHKYEAYYVDLTPKMIRGTGCKVVKVISPDLQPHFFNEKYKLVGGLRMSNVPKKLGYKQLKRLNSIPHPFL